MSIRYLMTYSGVDYSEKLYTQEDLGGNLPAMPYLHDKNGTKVTETLKILQHLAQTYKTDLMGSSEEDKSLIEMMSKFCVELNDFLSKYCYGGNQDQPLDDVLYQKVSPLTSFLKGGHEGALILGSKICYLDFYLYEMTQLLDFLT